MQYARKRLCIFTDNLIIIGLKEKKLPSNESTSRKVAIEMYDSFSAGKMHYWRTFGVIAGAVLIAGLLSAIQ
ncbi:MAG: hypothetical protein JJE36_04350 [Coriobacteriia bacterium]|nr:hypothetical protein [Coriobacteriia bacterium]